ncbi:MAG: hypothetical protein RBT13_03905 [Bacteroidales bacterium]|jgi:hypothetical protein|nr:hypothetical protein [Bacteroidales bacterium]NLO41753.1 hypothetical protein [Bacteroidales bacterium]
MDPYTLLNEACSVEQQVRLRFQGMHIQFKAKNKSLQNNNYAGFHST